MENKIFYSDSLANTYTIATNFCKELQVGNIIVLEGELGVGKTEFVRAICKNIGINDIITSPTFTLINKYNSEFANVYHIDLYRIKSRDELLWVGFQELFDTKDAIFFVEWAENSFGLMPIFNYKISIKHNDSQTTRIIEIATSYSK